VKQGLGAEKQRSGAGRRGIFTKKVHKCTEKGRQEGVFGPHRREQIAFLLQNGQAWLRRSKAAPKRSKPMHFCEKGSKNTPKRDGRKRVWTAQARADRVFGEIRRRQAWAPKKRGSGVIKN